MRAMLTGAALGVVLGATAVGVSAVAWPDSEYNSPRYEAAFEQLSLFTEVMARARQPPAAQPDCSDLRSTAPPKRSPQNRPRRSHNQKA